MTQELPQQNYLQRDYDMERWLDEDIRDDGPHVLVHAAVAFSGAVTTLLAEHVVWPLCVAVWAHFWQ